MYLLANENLGALMFGVGVLMLIVLLLRRARRYQRKTKRENAAPLRQNKKLEQARKETPLLDAPPELLRWQVEMHETARHLKAELDSKMSALQSITRIAAEESTRLEAAIARAKQLGVSPCVDPLAAIDDFANGDQAASEALAEDANSLDSDIANKRQSIYDLADQGLAASVIAQSVGAPIGDVELMMSLRSNNTSPGS